jgi:MFS transporter, DHA1 family, tetracycline resistance protein
VLTGLGFAILNIVLSYLLPETRRGDNPHGKINLLEICKEASPFRLVGQLRGLRTHRPRLFSVFVLQSLVTFSIGYYSYFVIFAAESPIQLDSQGIALIFLYFALLGVISNTFFFAKVLIRVPPLPTIRVLLLIGTFVVASYGIWGGNSLLALYITLTVDMLTISLVPALLEGFIGKAADETERGELFGISQGIAALMAVISAVVATVFSVVDLRLPFVAFALATAAAFVWSLRVTLPKAVTGEAQ